MSFGQNLKYFKKTLKFKSKNTTPGEQKGKRLFIQFNNCLT